MGHLKHSAVIATVLLLWATLAGAAPSGRDLFPGFGRFHLHRRNAPSLPTRANLTGLSLPTTTPLVGVANATYTAEPTEEITVVSQGSVEVLEWRQGAEQREDGERVADLKRRGVLAAVPQLPCRREERRAVPDVQPLATSTVVNMFHLLENMLVAFNEAHSMRDFYCEQEEIMGILGEKECYQVEELTAHMLFPDLSVNHTNPTNVTMVMNDLLQGNLNYLAVLDMSSELQEEVCLHPKLCDANLSVLNTTLECGGHIVRRNLTRELTNHLLNKALESSYYGIMRKIPECEIYAVEEEAPIPDESLDRESVLLYTLSGTKKHIRQLTTAICSVCNMCDKTISGTTFTCQTAGGLCESINQTK